MRSVPASTSMRCAVRTAGPGTASVPAPFFVKVAAAMDVAPVNTVSPAVSRSNGCPATPSMTGVVNVCAFAEAFVSAFATRSCSAPPCVNAPAFCPNTRPPSARPAMSKSVAPPAAMLNAAASPFCGASPPVQLPPVVHLPPSFAAPLHSVVTFSRFELRITSAPFTTESCASMPFTANFAASPAESPEAMTV